MTQLFYDTDADLSLLKNKTIAIIGYGSQGHAHALNLKDSGMDVIVGLYKGSNSESKAINDGLKVFTVSEACEKADWIMILLPDEFQKEVYIKEIEPNLKEGKILSFAHGFNIRFELIKPPNFVDVVMIAPKGPGHTVRWEYQNGQGVPALFAVEQDYSGNARSLAMSYAKGIGGTRAGILETNFKEETETDLFGEQVVLCGGVTELIRSGYDTLVDAGYDPNLAYFECLHELKLIVDLIYEGGIGNMRYSISTTAAYGDVTRGPRIITDETRSEMKKILSEIQSGSFAREFILENQANRPVFNALLRKGKEHRVEQIGEKLRKMMPFVGKKLQ